MTPMKKLWLLLFAAFAATGCKEDSDPEIFSGKDNYIASFALTKDGVTYNATISQDRITVTVPYNVSLTNAVATCEIAENASIQPAPATVTEWELDRQFLVTSYNKTDRAYLYSVEYADVVSAGNVTLDTQQEVTNFGQTGISAIDGNLSIGTRRSDDPVTDLGGLEHIVSVGNNLTIGAVYAGKMLAGKSSGLSKLKEVRGNIVLSEENTSLTDFSLPALKTATGNITLVSKALESVEMPALERVGGTLEVRSNALVLMTADLLAQIDGGMTLSGSTSKTPSAPCDYFYFPALRTIAGNLSLSYFSSLSNTGIIFPVLARAGNVTYEALPKANAFTLPEATTLGDISLTSCSAMTEISLPVLTTAGSLQFQGTTQVRKFECPELVSLTGTLYLDRLVAFTSLKTAFPKLTRIDGNLYMSNLSSLENTLDLSGYTFGPESIVTLQATTLSNLKTIAGSDNFEGGLSINGTGFTPSPAKLPFALTGFKSVRSFHIAGFPMLTELSLPIETCDDLTLESCGGNSATGLRLEMPALTEVRRTLLCRSLGRMDTGSSASFPKLKSVGIQLSMYTNASYLSAIDFPVLETVGNGEPIAESTADDYALMLMPVGCTGGFSLPKLKTVNGNALFSTWTAATTKVPSIACPELATVTGNLEIGHTNTAYKTSVTTGLDFRQLQQARSVRIGNLAALKDFSFFAAVVPQLSEETWSVTECGYNPTWKDMNDGKYIAQ
jgi:hypothetical protein